MQLSFSHDDIMGMDKISRLKLINAVTGIKPANLIGTINERGQTNLAIFSSVVHLGSHPPLIGFMMRPTSEVPRHTYENIIHTGAYTINHVHSQIIEKAHYTSAKFDRDISEFDRCGLTTEFQEGFVAPFVRESHFKMAMQLEETIPIKRNNTILIIGSIQHLLLPKNALDEGEINLENSDGIGISGLNSYYSLSKVASYPYARISSVPDFSS